MNSPPPTFQVALSPWLTLTDDQTRGEQVAFDIGPDEQAYLAFAQQPLDYRVERSHGSFVRTRGREPQTYRVLAFSEIGCSLDLTISDEPFNIHSVQPLGEELLLACARCVYHGSGDFDRNGRVYSREGVFRREILLGDGIQSLQTTSTGTIWTSYFDEGVFGNRGWYDPVGSSGLVSWNSGGGKESEFQPGGGLDQICDCYALNVASDRDVWLYYYTSFPLVHMRDRTVRGVWKVPIAGSHHLVVGHGYVLMDGGYDDRNAFWLLKLWGKDNVEAIARLEFSGFQGEELGSGFAAGRGNTLYFQNGQHLYRYRIEDALTFEWESASRNP